MPRPKDGESEDDFVKRCIPVVMNEGTAEDGSQAAAICHSMWDHRHNSRMSQIVHNLSKLMTKGRTR